ncbi:MAG: hypothetical protein IPO41_18095 [Acidobacteria bacterium]|nr:hypothetical protein [Acidobacteriota bacterium]
MFLRSTDTGGDEDELAGLALQTQTLHFRGIIFSWAIYGIYTTTLQIPQYEAINLDALSWWTGATLRSIRISFMSVEMPNGCLDCSEAGFLLHFHRRPPDNRLNRPAGQQAKTVFAV